MPLGLGLRRSPREGGRSPRRAPQAGWLRTSDGRALVEGACEFGHTDHTHANLSSVGECRRTLRLDQCEDEPPPFVCVCVSEAVRDRVRDPLSDDERFNLVAAAFFCLGTAGFMLALRLHGCVRPRAHARHAACG